jgi:dGTPase
MNDAMPERFSFLDRAAKQRHEEEFLIAAALRSSRSAGRALPEAEDVLRTPFERDRDRIIHCTAFRRLMYKTQVFVNSEGDHHRTRLSHSLEVAQVARSLASALRLNETFCEALSLAHDIGHPPFGHRGEWALDKLMKDYGGFRHNAQVLRVVDQLERRSPDYAGLNLTRELRESLLKHEKAEDWPAEFGARPRAPWLEAQVVDLADSTAYNVHDIEDGLRAQMFSEHDLEQEVGLWRLARETVERRHPGFLASTDDVNLRIKRISNEVLKTMIEDLIRASAARIDEVAPPSVEAVRQTRGYMIGHGVVIEPLVAELHQFLYRRFYRHERLQELARRASAILSQLFEVLRANPAELPPWYRAWVDRVGLERALCDYLAGMTDRFAEREHARLCGG